MPHYSHLKPMWRWPFALSIVLLLVSGALAVRQSWRFSQANTRVEQTYQVIDAIDQLMDRLLEAETGLRGYLLTHDRLLLQPYDDVRAQTTQLREQLNRLVANSEGQTSLVRQLNRAVDVKLDEMALVLAPFEAGRTEIGLERFQDGHTHRSWETVRALAAEMRAIEAASLAEGATEARLARRGALGLGFASLLGALALSVVAVSVHRGFERRRVEYEREIAIRRQAEISAREAVEDLRESEGLNRSILGSSADCITMVHIDGRLLSINEPGLRLFELDHADGCVGRPWPELWGPSATLASHALSTALGSGGGRFQGRCPTSRGRDKWWDVLVTPIRDSRGETVRLVSIARDITEQKHAEEQLRDSEREFRTLADTLPQIVWRTRPDGYHDYFNERWHEYTGMPRPHEPGAEQDLGWAWKDYVHAADLDGTLSRWMHSLATGSAYHVEYRIRRHDGVYRWFIGRALPLRDHDGSITGWFGTCTDIEDQKRAEEERNQLLASERAARSEAERTARMKDEFVSTLSHELRTPLNAILGWVGILKQDQAGDTLVRAVDVIDRNARRQSQMIDDLLDVSRIISGKLRLDIQRIDPASIIDEAIASAQPTADAKGVRLTRQLGPAGTIQGDPGRLQQVVWNLVVNAIKFTPRDGRVQVTLRPVDNHAEIEVSDTGIGIRPEFLPHVFQRFRQADASATRKHGGLGLGLAIVKNLVELHGGTVDASSGGEGRGATFTVRLPMAPTETDAEQAVAAASSHGPPSALGGLLDELTVLVLDDEPDARDLVQRLLGDAGARATTAASAADALQLIEAGFVPDIILSDIGMPEQDGFEFMRRVRAFDGPVSNVPAAALTALARVEDRKRALLAGYQAHLAKPVDPAELVAMVASLAGRTGRLLSL